MDVLAFWAFTGALAYGIYRYDRAKHRGHYVNDGPLAPVVPIHVARARRERDTQEQAVVVALRPHGNTNRIFDKRSPDADGHPLGA